MSELITKAIAKQRRIAAGNLIALAMALLSACSGGNDAESVPSSSSSAVTSSAVNSPPTITGTPPTTGTVNTLYTFTPTGIDPNGDTLGYTITGKPAWATFNTSTGQLSGTPTAAGSFTGIVISVSDRSLSTSLPAFTLTVTAPAATTATLTWTQPNFNTDGSPLIDLTGYVVYYGTSQTVLTNTKPVTGAATTMTTITGLTAGLTYYFAIASVSTSGGEGTKSNTVSARI
jgi:hypothetical protein